LTLRIIGEFGPVNPELKGRSVKPFPYVGCADAGKLNKTANIRAAVNPAAKTVLVLIVLPLCTFNS
jgi:hypothetical protein